VSCRPDNYRDDPASRSDALIDPQIDGDSELTIGISKLSHYHGGHK